MELTLNEAMVIFIKKATMELKKPIAQDELELLLIDKGIDEVFSNHNLKQIKKGQLSRWMEEAGFSRKQMMIDNIRQYYWVKNGLALSGLNEKIRLKHFIKKVTSDIDQILFSDLRQLMLDEGFSSDSWQSHFYYTDPVYEGQNKIVNGWILSGNGKDKVYKKVESAPKEPPENDF